MDGSRCFQIALAAIIAGTVIGAGVRAYELMVVFVIAGVAGFFVCTIREGE